MLLQLQAFVILYLLVDNTSRGYLSDFCPLHVLVEKGHLTRRNAFIGFNVSIGLQSYAVDETTGKYDALNPYFPVEIFDEIAKNLVRHIIIKW